MVGASIHAVDHGVGCSVELVVETARDQPPDDWPHGVPVIECKVGNAAFDALLGQSAVYPPDDVVALAQCPHHGLRVLRQAPSCRTQRLGEAETLQFLHTADHGGTRKSVRSAVDTGPKVHDPIMLGSLSREYAVEVGPTIGLDLSVQIATDIEIASRSELEDRQIGGARAQTVADVVACNHQVATIVG